MYRPLLHRRSRRHLHRNMFLYAMFGGIWLQAPVRKGVGSNPTAVRPCWAHGSNQNGHKVHRGVVLHSARQGRLLLLPWQRLHRADYSLNGSTRGRMRSRYVHITHYMRTARISNATPCRIL